MITYRPIECHICGVPQHLEGASYCSAAHGHRIDVHTNPRTGQQWIVRAYECVACGVVQGAPHKPLCSASLYGDDDCWRPREVSWINPPTD